jgi:hypothetical protein
MAHETRNQYCWSCKYFDPDTDEVTQGHCMRRAPSRNDYDIGTLVVATGGDYNMFPIILDATDVLCGDYERMEGTIPDIPEPA